MRCERHSSYVTDVTLQQKIQRKDHERESPKKQDNRF